MNRTIVTIRPEPGCGATVAAGRELGLTIEQFPLFAIEPIDWSMPSGPFDGLLLGSANALRHAGAAVDSLVQFPVFAVGETTAAAAAGSGLRIAAVGSGGLQVLLDSLAGKSLRLLRLGGQERVPLVPPTGIEIVDRVAYRSVELPLPAELSGVLREGAVVLLHSAAAARHIAAECERLGIGRNRLSLAVLGPRIAAAAGEGWRELRTAAEPSDPALLALAREMCHEPFVG